MGSAQEGWEVRKKSDEVRKKSGTVARVHETDFDSRPVTALTHHVDAGQSAGREVQALHVGYVCIEGRGRDTDWDMKY